MGKGTRWLVAGGLFMTGLIVVLLAKNNRLGSAWTELTAPIGADRQK